jgi:hypothetical protein
MTDATRCSLAFSFLLTFGMSYPLNAQETGIAPDARTRNQVEPAENAEVWPSFRGVSGDGHSDARNVPLTWGADTNIKWRAELPESGDSSPVISGDRVFITCAQERGQKRSLYCFSRTNGRELWQQTVTYDDVAPTHKTNPYCASTPLTVGKRIIVWHGSAGLFCYDHDGQELWSRDLGEFRHMWGYGASPIFHKDRIILNCGPGKRTFLTAVDLASGTTLWQTDEPTRDGGKSFETLRSGLPQEHCYDIVFRHGLETDNAGRQLAMGSSTGGLWVSENEGDDWSVISNTLPQIYVVRFSKRA